MPTENELKYVIKIDSEKVFQKLTHDATLIQQAYIANTPARIRSKTYLGRPKKATYEFCYKVDTGKRVIEIETPITMRDFLELWELTTTRLVKVRYNVVFRKGKKKALWEVDFFRAPKIKTYFAMAEHEMPEGQKQPDFIPDVITENLVFQVPQGDSRFSSRRLGQIDHAQRLYKKVKALNRQVG